MAETENAAGKTTSPMEVANGKTRENATGTLGDAIAWAARAHSGQYDKGGEPYILHPLRVMSRMGTEPLRIAAVMHDMVEDCGVTLGQGEATFGPVIADAIDALTRREGESYTDFIDRCRQNYIARKVKLEDLHDNMDLSRLGREPTDADKRRYEKYVKAGRRLIASSEGE